MRANPGNGESLTGSTEARFQTEALVTETCIAFASGECGARSPPERLLERGTQTPLIQAIRRGSTVEEEREASQPDEP